MLNGSITLIIMVANWRSPNHNVEESVLDIMSKKGEPYTEKILAPNQEQGIQALAIYIKFIKKDELGIRGYDFWSSI